ncbi:hypothetical protein N0V90_011281 [Kalmusia sp. IMI 367209]|nr:hypothetical protein N0V90_011281 [Kalmusia sp. IMI 367209]
MAQPPGELPPTSPTRPKVGMADAMRAVLTLSSPSSEFGLAYTRVQTSIDAINALLDKEAAAEGYPFGGLPPLLRQFQSRSACEGFGDMVDFANTGVQMLVSWRNCKAHKTRLVGMDLSDVQAVYKKIEAEVHGTTEGGEIVTNDVVKDTPMSGTAGSDGPGLQGLRHDKSDEMSIRRPSTPAPGSAQDDLHQRQTNMQQGHMPQLLTYQNQFPHNSTFGPGSLPGNMVPGPGGHYIVAQDQFPFQATLAPQYGAPGQPTPTNGPIMSRGPRAAVQRPVFAHRWDGLYNVDPYATFENEVQRRTPMNAAQFLPPQAWSHRLNLQATRAPQINPHIFQREHHPNEQLNGQLNWPISERLNGQLNRQRAGHNHFRPPPPAKTAEQRIREEEEDRVRKNEELVRKEQECIRKREERAYQRQLAEWNAQQADLERKRRAEEDRTAKVKSELKAEMYKGNQVLAYRYRDYMALYPCRGQERLSSYYLNLLANQQIQEDDQSDGAMAVRYAKEKWFMYWTAEQKEMVMQIVREKRLAGVKAQGPKREIVADSHLMTEGDIQAIRDAISSYSVAESGVDEESVVMG